MDRNCFFVNILFIFLMCCFLLLKASADIDDVNLSSKMQKEVKIMEERHFNNKFEEESPETRLNRLEIELMGRSYENLPTDDRIKTLKLASQKRALHGAAFPCSLCGQHLEKLNGTSVQVVSKNDDVGIIDGLLRAYNPDFFYGYRAYKDRQYEMFYK